MSQHPRESKVQWTKRGLTVADWIEITLEERNIYIDPRSGVLMEGLWPYRGDIVRDFIKGIVQECPNHSQLKMIPSIVQRQAKTRAKTGKELARLESFLPLIGKEIERADEFKN